MHDGLQHRTGSEPALGELSGAGSTSKACYAILIAVAVLPID
jgi:hypothetical protein